MDFQVLFRPVSSFFRKRTPQELAQELALDHHRRQIESESHAAYYAKLAEYHREGRERLKPHLR